MKLFLGIDLSSTSTGVTLLDEKGDLIFTYAIQVKDKDINKRYVETKKILFNGALSEFKKEELNIAIESPSFFSKGKTITMAAGWGYVYFSLLEGNYNVVTYTPSQIKKFATGNGRADKQMMYDSLSDEMKLEIDSSSYKKKDDLVDSYWIALMRQKG